MEVHLITCTGGRPEAFELCCRWVDRWRMQSPSRLHWIVVDDGFEPTNGCPAWAEYFYVKRTGLSGHTLARNLQTALGYLEAHDDDAIFFIEDDDYYGSAYLGRMLSQLNRGFLAVGQNRAAYYNIEHLRFRVLENTHHASLAQTAFRCAVSLPIFARIVQRSIDTQRTDIDVQFWQEARALNSFLFPETFDFVGMKGMPGRKGIGIGHRPNSHWQFDAELAQLKAWLGDGLDFEAYKRIINAA